MKPMIRRLRLLEEAWQVVIEVEREDSPAAIIRARRLRRLQMEGIAPETRPPVQFPRGTTLADILRHGRHGARSTREEAAQ
jgi:hypothetical protein